MKLDPKLVALLEKTADPNRRLLEALGVCPTCGQPMPRGIPDRGKPRKRGETTASIIEFLTRDKEYGCQTRCARALGIKTSYVNAVWKEHQRGAKSPRGKARGEADE